MPLSREELEALQAESMADDVEIELDRMSRWTADEARAYIESGGAVAPADPSAASAEGPPVLVCFYSGGLTAAQGRKAVQPLLSHAPGKVRRPAFIGTRY